MRFDLRPEEPKRGGLFTLNPSTGHAFSRPRFYERMPALGRRARVPSAHAHRLRDTLAVDILSREASPYDVAKMLGDTIETVERHSTPLVRELRERVRTILGAEGGLEKITVTPASQSTVGIQ